MGNNAVGIVFLSLILLTISTSSTNPTWCVVSIGVVPRQGPHGMFAVLIRPPLTCKDSRPGTLPSLADGTEIWVTAG